MSNVANPVWIQEKVDRFWAKLVDGPDGCWLWTRCMQNGYGILVYDKQQYYAHRFSYELLRAEIPEGLQLDHLCRVTNCVNPWHLEPVTGAVNTGRGMKANQTECKRGHPLSGENISRGKYGQRQCRTCSRDLRLLRAQTRRAA